MGLSRMVVSHGHQHFTSRGGDFGGRHFTEKAISGNGGHGSWCLSTKSFMPPFAFTPLLIDLQVQKKISFIVSPKGTDETLVTNSPHSILKRRLQNAPVKVEMEDCILSLERMM
jgi:hypothetical protein